MFRVLYLALGQAKPAHAILSWEKVFAVPVFAGTALLGFALGFGCMPPDMGLSHVPIGARGAKDASAD